MPSGSPAPSYSSGMAHNWDMVKKYFIDERPESWKEIDTDEFQYEEKKSFLWMVLVYQANEDQLPVNKIIDTFNDPNGWKGLFTSSLADKAPEAVQWNERLEAKGENNWWNFILVPVPLSQFNTQGELRTAIQRRPLNKGGVAGGYIGLQEDLKSTYYELFPLEKFVVQYESGIRSEELLETLERARAIRKKDGRRKGENGVSGNEVVVYSIVPLMRMWAMQYRGDNLPERVAVWGDVSKLNGKIIRPYIIQIKDAAQEENDREGSDLLSNLRASLSIGGGDLLDGELPKPKEKTKWWLYALAGLSAVGLLFLLGFIFMNNNRGGGMAYNMGY